MSVAALNGVASQVINNPKEKPLSLSLWRCVMDVRGPRRLQERQVKFMR